MSVSHFYRWQGEDLLLSVKVQPRARRDEIAGILGTQIKIRIKAPPVDGRANNHLIGYLAKLFEVPKSRIKIVSGESGRDKRVAVCSPERLPDIFTQT